MQYFDHVHCFSLSIIAFILPHDIGQIERSKKVKLATAEFHLFYVA